ncbi:MAG: hypothetical protein RJA34_1889 [Pseudomonadota bacterium]|jgi:hypothetical protein
MNQQAVQLCALTCETVAAPDLSISATGDQPAAPLVAPLGSKVSCAIADLAMRDQIVTTLQMLAAVQALRHPWLTLDGLFRLIVAVDRQAAVLANRQLLEAVGQSADMQLDKNSAFAFPCDHGIVVILPVEIVRYALAPNSEVERQYGLTTIWHELAHVHALALHYWSDQRLRMPSASYADGWIDQAWHEFFADRHSRWPGFSADLELDLVRRAWAELQARPSPAVAQQLLIRLASAYGRSVSCTAEFDRFCAQLPELFNSQPAITLWKHCAVELDVACARVQTDAAAPPLEGIAQTMKALAQHWVAVHL